MDFLELLRAKLAALLDEERALNDQAEAIFAAAAAEQRADLTDSEDQTLASMKARRDAITAERAATEARCADIESSRQAQGDAAKVLQSFNINRNPSKDEARGSDHTLDELLWASSDSVAAGSFDRTGTFAPHSAARNSVERIEARNADGQQVVAPRITELPEVRRAAVRQFQQTVADMQTWGMLVDRSAKTGADGFLAARNHRIWKEQYGRVLRAMDVDTSAEGTEWVPTGIGSMLHEKVRAAGKVAALFPRINLPTNPWKWPIEGTDASAYRVAEPTSDTATIVTASTPGTVAATFDAEIMGGRVLFSKSLDADSALAILPYVQAKLVQAFADAEEKAILDGDTDGTHQDTDTQAVGATHFSSAWDGLRKRALANASSAGGAALSVAILATIRSQMGKWGVNPAQLAFIMGVSSFYDIISDTSVLTVDKMGPQATILNGQVASIYGVPIIVSEHVRENLNASGVHDAITTTKTYALCVNRGEWAMGQRSPMAIEVDDSRYVEYYQRLMVGFMREDFQNIGDASTNDDTSISYNITP